MKIQKRRILKAKMNNYSIDGSVYAFPFKDRTGDAKEIKNYCDTIRLLSRLVKKENSKNKMHPRHIKYFIFSKDIQLIKNNKALFFSRDTIAQLKIILKNNGINISFDVSDAQISFQNIIDRLNTTPLSSGNEDFQNIILFENWFDIENIIFKPDKEPSLSDEIIEEIKNKDLRKNLRKNLAKIAFLNENVYKSGNVHSIILNDYVQAQSVTVSNLEFDIIMTNGSYQKYNKKTNRIETYNYTYTIKNAPIKNSCIKDQKVNISTFNILFKNNFRYKIMDWEKALSDAKDEFNEHLEFFDCKTSLEEYINKIMKERSKFISKPYEIGRIDEWMEMGPNTLYENFKALNSFMANMDLKLTRKGRDERYHCCRGNRCCENKECFEDRSNSISCVYKCEFLDVCGSNIRYFGDDCADEKWEHKNDSFVQKDRTKIKEGIEYKYWHHLRPFSLMCCDPLWFLSLRIHFRRLGLRKIEIGLIGRHRYLPCQFKSDISKCWRRGCPLNPNSKHHDPTADDYNNFLKQWQ
jgi:hypothetical protein